MFEENSLLAAIRYILPLNDILGGKNNQRVMVSNRFLFNPDYHLEKYKKVYYNSLLIVRN